MIIYIAGPYRGTSQVEIASHIYEARKVAIEVWEAGHVALCPHLNTAHFEEDCSTKDTEYLEGDFQLLARCDSILMIKDWELSKGALAEKKFAEERKIPIYIYPELPALHPTEQKRPTQAAAFIDIVMKMYRVHLDKNADYSPANIAGTGEIGLMTRIWDKVARLMNLVGFKIDVSSMQFELSSVPKCEALEDSVLDLAVYAIIWQLYRRGVWGK